MKVVQGKVAFWLLLSGHGILTTNAFCVNEPCSSRGKMCMTASGDDESAQTTQGKKDNKAMAFLRKIGKVGGASNQDFMNAVGVDEGPAGKTSGDGTKQVRKAKSAYKECTQSGVVDDMTETFPFTSSGTEWAGYTDRVMGGMSSGSITRETVQGKTANVLRGEVSLANNGGFVQMATDLAVDPSVGVVDASQYDGLELDVLFEGEGDTESFNVHLKTPACQRQFSSYRGTFEIPKGSWETVRLPWSAFKGNGPGADDTPFDPSALRRLGVVAIGREMDVFLALSGLRFYSVF